MLDFRNFMDIVNIKSGCFAVLPYSGGYLEQPYRLMQVYSLMLSELRKYSAKHKNFNIN